MTNHVVFTDGHTEPILWYDEQPGRVEVVTSSGIYSCCEYIVTYPIGWKHKAYQFFYYRVLVDRQTSDWASDWVATDNIKNFCFKKEN